MTLAIVAASAMGAPNEKPPDRRGLTGNSTLPLLAQILCFDAEDIGTEDSSCALLSLTATSKEQALGMELERNGPDTSSPIAECGRLGEEMVGGSHWLAMTFTDVTSGVSSVARRTCDSRFARTVLRT